MANRMGSWGLWKMEKTNSRELILFFTIFFNYMSSLFNAQILGVPQLETEHTTCIFGAPGGGGGGGQDALYKCAYKGGGGALRRLRSGGGGGSGILKSAFELYIVELIAGLTLVRPKYM